MSKPDGICFDLDGVLVHTMPLHARAWQEALAPLGLRVSRRAIYEWEGEPGIVSAGTLLKQTTPRPSPGAVSAVLRDKERRFTLLARRVSVPLQAQRLLNTLAARKLKLGLVTGTSWAEVRRVVPSRMLKLFGAVVTGDQVAHGKPHAEPYRLALRRLRLAPRRAVVVENAPYGIRSARRAGVGTVIALASSLPRRYLHEAHQIVGSVPQLCRLLEQLTQ